MRRRRAFSFERHERAEALEQSAAFENTPSPRAACRLVFGEELPANGCGLHGELLRRLMKNTDGYRSSLSGGAIHQPGELSYAGARPIGRVKEVQEFEGIGRA